MPNHQILLSLTLGWLLMLLAACQGSSGKGAAPQPPNSGDNEAQQGGSEQNPPTERPEPDALSPLRLLKQPSQLRLQPQIRIDPSHIEKKAGIILQLFEWRWADIARECQQFLGPAGIAYVQISPPNEHVRLDYADGVRQPWYQRYQPVSYRLESRSGSRAALEQMIQTCAESGVGILADAVINHMASVIGPQQLRFGSAGSSYSYYSYPDYSFDDFHHCDTAWGDIESYQDRWQVQNCELSNLADLKTESPKVQELLSDYLSDLLSIGVAGFRIDAAKHMPSQDLATIVRLSEQKSGQKALIIQEVIDPGNEAIKADEYTGLGRVTEFRYGTQLNRWFRQGRLDELDETALDGSLWQGLASNDALVFTDNHDRQRHGSTRESLSFRDGRLYELANVFLLGWPYGQVRLMSSYPFSSFAEGPPAKLSGETLALYDPQDTMSGCGEHWVCEHRSAFIVPMISFRNLTVGQSVTLLHQSGGRRLGFARGERGYVAINLDRNEGWTDTFQSALPAGLYCNLLQPECETPISVAADGRFTATIEAASALVLLAPESL